jgi:hypothetical protein
MDWVSETEQGLIGEKQVRERERWMDWVSETEQGLIGEKQVRESRGLKWKRRKAAAAKEEAEHRWIGGERKQGWRGRWHQSQQWEMATRKWFPLFAVGPPSFGFMSLLSIPSFFSRSCPGGAGLAPSPNTKSESPTLLGFCLGFVCFHRNQSGYNFNSRLDLVNL